MSTPGIAPTSRCREHQALQIDLDKILAELVETTSVQLELFRSRKYPDFMNVDKQLELMVGKKERAVGALREHVRMHKCQPGF